MQLHFFKTSITLLFVLHVEYLYQLERHDFFIVDALCFKDIRELALTNQLLNFKSVDDHANVEHDVVLSIRLVWIFLVHLRLQGGIVGFAFIFRRRHYFKYFKFKSN